MKEIQLTQGKVALVDDEDFDMVCGFKWRFTKHGYAERAEPRDRGENQKTVKMHRQILGLSKGDGIDCDHINGNTLDNRRSNLRSCSHAENTCNRKINKNNTSGFKGVAWDKKHKKWKAQIMVNGKQKHLGHFSTPKEGHSAYKDASLKYHGDFANFGDGCVLI